MEGAALWIYIVVSAMPIVVQLACIWLSIREIAKHERRMRQLNAGHRKRLEALQAWWLSK